MNAAHGSTQAEELRVVEEPRRRGVGSELLGQTPGEEAELRRLRAITLERLKAESTQ